MIEHIFAAEFDLLKGAVVRYVQPMMKTLSNENILAGYMIPDGSHKRDKDVNYFKLDLRIPCNIESTENLRYEFNARQPLAYVYNLEKNWAAVVDNFGKKIEVGVTMYKERLNLKSQNGQICLDYELKNIEEFKNLFEGYIQIKTNSKHIGLHFLDSKNSNLLEAFLFKLISCKGNNDIEPVCERKFYFQNHLKIKKDSSLQRGALIRSIALCSSTINIFHYFQDSIWQYLDDYLNLAVELDDKAVESLRIILNNAIQAVNNKIRSMPLNLLYISPDDMNYVSISSIVKDPHSKLSYFSFETSLTSTSLLKFISLFQERTMIIYNAILKGSRILFVSADGSCEEISNLVSACLHMVSPLNIFSKLFPFEHLLNISFLEVEGFIAGVSNPLFKSRKNWWDVCCDISDGSVIEQVTTTAKSIKGQEDQGDVKLQQLDFEFIQDILKRMKEKEITEAQVRKNFYDYTKNFIDFSINSSDIIDYAKEDKWLLEAFENKSNKWKKTVTFELYQNYLLRSREILKVVFSEKHLAINTALNNFVEKKAFNDFDLLTDYTNLIEALTDPFRIEVLLKFLLARKPDLTALSVGMISSNKEIQMKNSQLFGIFEAHRYGKSIMSLFSYYTLFIYENLKFYLSQDDEVNDEDNVKL